jgi:hypothetical protein
MIRGVLLAGAALLMLPVLIASIVAAVLGGTGAEPGPHPGSAAATDIPPGYLSLYITAASASCPGLDWTVLAAIGKIESNHGRSRLPGVTSGENHAGAGGPMQFLQATFDAVVATHPPPPGGAHPPSRYHPHDAIWAAGAYLCDSGAPARLDEALFVYSHSRQYVADVLVRAAAYRAALPANPATGAGASVAGRIALDYARGQIGLPYLWGGK